MEQPCSTGRLASLPHLSPLRHHRLKKKPDRVDRYLLRNRDDGHRGRVMDSSEPMGDTFLGFFGGQTAIF